MNDIYLIKNENWIDTINACIDTRSKNTKIAYKNDLQQFVEIMSMDLLTETEKDYMKYFKELEDRNYTYSSINRKITALSKYLDYLVIVKKLPYNPINNIRKVSRLYRNMDKKVNIDLTMEDVKKVIRFSRIQTSLIIQLLVNTGLRISELISIKRNDIKLKDEYVEIRIKGKGKKERIVYIDNGLYEKIRKIFDKNNEFLFHSKNGRQLSRQNLYKQIHNAFKKLSNIDVHPHTLRHFCATYRHIEKGEDIKAISNYLGHSTSAITLDMYIDSKITPEKAMIV